MTSSWYPCQVYLISSYPNLLIIDDADLNAHPLFRSEDEFYITNALSLWIGMVDVSSCSYG